MVCTNSIGNHFVMSVGELLVCLEINTGISGWVKNFLFLIFHMRRIKRIVMARTELPEDKRMRRKSPINIIQTSFF